jgi:hypothetical protein
VPLDPTTGEIIGGGGIGLPPAPEDAFRPADEGAEA